MTDPEIDPLSFTSLRVSSCFNEEVLSDSSAYVVCKDGEYFLITNWHVVTGRNIDTGKNLCRKTAGRPNCLKVLFHKKGAVDTRLEFNMPLYDEDENPLWLEHPNNKCIDVVAIRLSEIDLAEFYPIDLSLEDVDMAIYPALTVSIIGYPLGLTVAGKWPIWKVGHIASDPEIDYEDEKPAFLIDGTTKKGMSGSPVVCRSSHYVTRSGSSRMGKRATRFLGTYSGRLGEKSDIGRVWKPITIIQIIAQ